MALAQLRTLKNYNVELDGVKDDDGKHKDVGLLEALKTALGVKITKETIKDYASKKWDQTTDWVKGWFK